MFKYLKSLISRIFAKRPEIYGCEYGYVVEMDGITLIILEANG